ncbi:Elongation of very long chain fatty acids protein F, partial [Gryllus bimaculatus]
MDNSKDYVGIQIYNGSYFYYLNKQFDLLETVFFILRKKFNQVTYLHLFHHISVSSGSWYGTKYYPGGNPVVSGLLNSAVHILMHTYYTMSLLKIKKFMRLKKYITQ